MSDKSHVKAHAAAPGSPVTASSHVPLTPPAAVINEILVQKTSMLMAVLDHEWRVARVNPAVETAFGYKEAEIRGRSVWDLGIMDEKELALSRERYRRLMSGELFLRYVSRFRTAAGDWRDMELSTCAVPSPDGRIDCFIIAGFDITDRLRLQEEVIRVSEQEQSRIGHDLHDSVGQTLTGAVALAEALEASASGEQRQTAARLREVVMEAATEVRRIAHGLSPSAVKTRGLHGALDLLAENVRQTHRIQCACALRPEIQSCTMDSDSHLLRIAQEAVSNAIRHGRASRLRLYLRESRQKGIGELEISNNGRCFDVGAAIAGKGLGLRVMEYRANIIGGEIRIQCRKGVGVSVKCRFPLAKNPAKSLDLSSR